MCTGNWPIPDEPYPDDELREWKIADDVFSKLEEPIPGFPDGIPYGLAVGNHDQNPPWNPYGNSTSSYAWTTADVREPVSIFLLKDGADMGVVTGNLDPDAGSFTWKVGNLADGTTVSKGSGYTLRIASLAEGVEDCSDAPFYLFDSTELSPDGFENQDLKKTELRDKDTGQTKNSLP